MATLGIGDWITGLKSANDNFAALIQERYSEEAGKTHLAMKEVRIQVDEAYRTITERIGALMIVNGEETYAVFFNANRNSRHPFGLVIGNLNLQVSGNLEGLVFYVVAVLNVQTTLEHFEIIATFQRL